MPTLFDRMRSHKIAMRIAMIAAVGVATSISSESILVPTRHDFSNFADRGVIAIVKKAAQSFVLPFRFLGGRVELAAKLFERTLVDFCPGCRSAIGMLKRFRMKLAEVCLPRFQPWKDSLSRFQVGDVGEELR
jgi:hypothetical protein